MDFREVKYFFIPVDGVKKGVKVIRDTDNNVLWTYNHGQGGDYPAPPSSGITVHINFKGTRTTSTVANQIYVSINGEKYQPVSNKTSSYTLTVDKLSSLEISQYRTNNNVPTLKINDVTKTYTRSSSQYCLWQNLHNDSTIKDAQEITMDFTYPTSTSGTTPASTCVITTI